MLLIVGKKYRLVFQVGNHALSFTGEIISVENDFIEFIDKFNKKLIYNKSSLISVEEVNNGGY